MIENDSDSKLSRVEEFVAKIGLFARQYPELKHKIYSSEAPYKTFAKVVNVCFTAPHGKEQVAFCTMIDGVYNPYGEKEFDVELYKTLINKLNCEFAKILSEKNNE